MEEEKKNISCPHNECGRKFDTKESLMEHINRRHKIEEQNNNDAKSPIESFPHAKLQVKTVQELDYKKLILEEGDFDSIEEADRISMINKKIKVFEPHKQLDMKIMENITTMTLSYNQIEEIEFLQFFPNLIELNLNNNQIENLWYFCVLIIHRPIEDLKQLRKLWVSNNVIKTIGALEECKEIKLVSLQNNKIFCSDHTFQILSKLRNLKTLNLAGNPVILYRIIVYK